MSQKFFQSVRKNQKQWMVVVTVLSMVSFLFLESLLVRGSDRSSNQLSPLGGGVLIGVLCGAAMCIIGYPRQKTTEYGLGGLAVGFLAGIIGFGALGANKAVVRTTAGSLTRTELTQLARNRQSLYQFLSMIARKAQTNFMGFGGTDDLALVYFQMLQGDAKKMGVRVSDERVLEYLKQLTQDRIEKSDYLNFLRDARLGESEMFELLKEELSVQIVMELLKPPSYLPPIPQGFAQFIRESPEAMSYMQPTPLQLWSTYVKLNVKESLQAVAIPVRDFKSQVPEPTDIELKTFFELNRGRMWLDEAQPGFLVPQKVQLAYLTADFEKFEKVAEPTDQDIKDYYEANKERYRTPLAKESTAPKLPDGLNDQDSPETKKDDPTKTEEKAPDPTDKPQPTGDANEKKEESQKPEAENKSEDEPKSNCGEGSTQEQSESKPAEEKAAPEQKPAAEEKPAETAKSSPPADEKPKSSLPDLSSSPESLPTPKYRELDDELKLQIRDEILRERAFLRITAELDRAKEFMVNLGLDYDSTIDKSKKEETARKITEQLKKYAQEHNLEYVETPELSYEELSTETIGLAFELKSRTPVTQDVFAQSERNEPRLPLFSVHRADLKSQHGAYAYWKIAELPIQVASLKDEAVHTKAVGAWKFNQARVIAEKRANELLKKVKAEGNDLPGALSGESVTGDKNDPAITIIATDPFSWLTTNRSVPGAPQDPMPSHIPLIENIGNDFMKIVFEDLNEGDLAVIADQQRAVYYIVKVLNRESAQTDDGGVAKQERQQKFMKEEFASRFYPLMKSPYQALAHYPQQQIDQLWRNNFQQSHQVVWEENTTPAPRRGK